MNPSKWMALAAWVALLAGATPLRAQEPASPPMDVPAAAGHPTAAPPERIVARPQRPGAAKRIARIPLYPFIGMGRGLERGMLAVEEHRLQHRLAWGRQWLLERGIQPLTGGMGTGTGFAFGVRLFDDDFGHPRIRGELPLRYSTNGYQQFEAGLGVTLAGSHWVPRGRALFVDFHSRYRSRPQEDFFGAGPGSVVADRTTYHLQDRTLGATLGSEMGALRLATDLGYTNTRIFRGRDPGFPSTGERFPGLPGLAEGLSLLRYGFTASVEMVDRPGDPHRGFRWRGSFHRVDARGSSDFDFYDSRLAAEGYIPLGRPRTIALRALAEFRSPRGGAQVPFYLLPYLGGAGTMRGFREFRFRDRNALLVNLEYRYEIWKYMDFVAFLDQGQVAPRVAGFTWAGFRTGYGGGIRVKGARGVGLRFDVGRSVEGTRFYFTFSPEF